MVGNINIFVGGISAGTMSHYYPDGVSCGKADVNVVKKAGTYSWYATSSGGASWNGSINIEEGKCQLMELTGGGGGGGGGNGCNYSLNGIWTRKNDGACTGAAGLKVFFSGGQGSIQSAPSNSCGFVTGQVKWRNFNPGSCTIEDLNMPTGNYLSYSVTFTDQNTIRIGSVTYTK
jgi:hypothetical protein